MNKLKNGLSSIFTIASNMATGVDQSVPEAIRLSRIDLCNSCPKLMPTRQCGECLCFVDLKTKYKQEKCPVDKWVASE